MHHLPSGENQRHAAAAVLGGVSRTTSSKGSSPPSQAPAASRCATCEASRTLGPCTIAMAWLWAACRHSAAPHSTVAPRQRRTEGRRPSTASAMTSAISRSVSACPKTVPDRTVGVASRVAASPEAPASRPDSATSQTAAKATAANRLMRQSRVRARQAGPVTSAGAPAKARGATATPNTSVPNADNRDATAAARRRVSASPPSGSKGGMVQGWTVNW